VQADRLDEVGALGVFLVVAIVDPAQAMGGDFPVRSLHRRDLIGRAGKRGGDAIDRDRHIGFGKQPVQPPEAGAGAVFVDGFHVPMAFARPWHGTGYLREKGFRGLVAMKDAVFAAFLVIDHELHCDMRAARPCCIRWIGSIAAHVTQITHVRNSGLAITIDRVPKGKGLHSPQKI
jgi:hypothetical protein